MEKQLKCVLLLSLKEMALRRVAVLLWNDPDILASISKFDVSGFHTKESKEEWRENIEDKMKDKMLKLQLPKSLTKQMIGMIRPIGLLISRWKNSHENYLSNEKKKIIFRRTRWTVSQERYWSNLSKSKFEKEEICLPNSAKLFWTTTGMIDYRKTAEELLRYDALNDVQRFKLACIYCMEDNIPLMWEELSEESKKVIFCSGGLPRKLQLSCWPHILEGTIAKLDYMWRTSDGNLTSFNQWAFELSVEYSSKSAAVYFFHKLTHGEREVSLMRTVRAVLRNRCRTLPRNEELSELLSFLLSLISPEQQMGLVKARSYDFFCVFLGCPWPDLFLENLGLIWNFLPQNTYDQLIQEMARRYENSYPYFPKLFQEFLMQSPLDFKKWFVDEKVVFGIPAAYHLLYLFFQSEDSESIEIIFRNVDAADRVRLVCARHVLRLLYSYMMPGRWPMVEVCLREATLSQEDKERLKEAFMVLLRGGYIMPQGGYGDPKVKRFFELLDETDASADKEKKGQKRKLENCCEE